MKNKEPDKKINYPTLLQSANLITNSWFDHKQTNISEQLDKLEKINTTYVYTIKIKLFPSKEQKELIHKYFNDVIDVYNLTNEYIKEKKMTQMDVKNWKNIRSALTDKIRIIGTNNDIYRHTLDYSVKHCVEMYKSAFSNHKGVDKFDIKNLPKDKRRKNMVFEPNNFSKSFNGITKLGKIKSTLPLTSKYIKKNSILQYDRYKNTYTIITPNEKTEEIELKRQKKCGIDPGVRTFLTTYDTSNVFEIGTNTKEPIDKILKKIDKLNTNKESMKTKTFEKAYMKYTAKMQNKIDDMHKKVASCMVKKYREINIGRLRIKSVISNENNMAEITKRRLVALSHYKFRMILKSIGEKYKCKINEVSEYKTSMVCHRCKNEKKDLGSNKVYNCEKCRNECDRDVNASINIYNNIAKTIYQYN